MDQQEEVEERRPKYLRKKGETYLYHWNEHLAALPDMIPIYDEVELKVVPQHRLTVKQKVERGLTLSKADIEAYPEYENYKPNGVGMRDGKNSEYVSDSVPKKKPSRNPDAPAQSLAE